MESKVTRVSDVMLKETVSVEGMASVKEIVNIMRGSGVEEVLVQRRNETDAWGIVSIMDIVNKVLIPEKDPQMMFAYEIMTKPVVSVPANMDIRYAARLLQRIGVRRAPVEDKGALVGMFSLARLVFESPAL